MEPIILASGSPRRQDFFRLLGLPFTCVPAMIDETPQQGLPPRQAVETIALQKVTAVAAQTGKAPWIFGADTVVVLNDEIFGKPADRDAAKTMLGRLAGQMASKGRPHEVITAMALYNGRTKTTDCRSVSCEVCFAPLTEAEIEWYLDSGEWEGVAGAYRLQGLGSCFISAINGSPSAVAGLPLHDFYVMLRDNGYPYGT